MDEEYEDWMSPEERFADNVMQMNERARIKHIMDQAEAEGRRITFGELFPMEPYDPNHVVMWGDDEDPVDTIKLFAPENGQKYLNTDTRYLYRWNGKKWKRLWLRGWLYGRKT